MAIAAINDWLGNRGAFTAGVLLLRAHGTLSKSEEFIFSLPESPVVRERLTTALRKINGAAAEQLAAAPLPAGLKEDETPEIQNNAFNRSIAKDVVLDFAPETMPPNLRKVVLEIRQAHKEMLVLKGIIINTPPGDELTRLAARAVELDHFNAAGWKQVEFWRATGRELHSTEKAKATLDRADALKRRQALRTWFSQRKEGAPNRRSFTQEEWNIRQHELDQLNTMLDGADQDQ